MGRENVIGKLMMDLNDKSAFIENGWFYENMLLCLHGYKWEQDKDIVTEGHDPNPGRWSRSPISPNLLEIKM